MPGGAGAQHVQADPPDDCGQPAAGVADVAGVGAGHPQPRLLQRVVRLAGRTEQAVGDRPQMVPVGLELGGGVHGYLSLVRLVMMVTRHRARR
jgi:hypothetical protein